MIDTNAVGSFLLHLAVLLCFFAALASLIGQRRKDGRLLIAGERAGYAMTAVIVCASLILVNAFVTHDYANQYVSKYSDKLLSSALPSVSILSIEAILLPFSLSSEKE